jgi:hypothetical protein
LVGSTVAQRSVGRGARTARKHRCSGRCDRCTQHLAARPASRIPHLSLPVGMPCVTQ